MEARVCVVEGSATVPVELVHLSRGGMGWGGVGWGGQITCECKRAVFADSATL